MAGVFPALLPALPLPALPRDASGPVLPEAWQEQRQAGNRPCVPGSSGRRGTVPMSSFPYDIQGIDRGIAAAHFDHSAKEKGIKGRFDPARELLLDFPDLFEYIYSWLRMQSRRDIL